MKTRRWCDALLCTMYPFTTAHPQRDAAPFLLQPEASSQAREPSVQQLDSLSTRWLVSSSPEAADAFSRFYSKQIARSPLEAT